MRLKFVSDMTKTCSNSPSQLRNTLGLCDVMILLLSFVVSAGLLGYLLFFRHFSNPGRHQDYTSYSRMNLSRTRQAGPYGVLSAVRSREPLGKNGAHEAQVL